MEMNETQAWRNNTTDSSAVLPKAIRKNQKKAKTGKSGSVSYTEHFMKGERVGENKGKGLGDKWEPFKSPRHVCGRDLVTNISMVVGFMRRIHAPYPSGRV